jgi:catechol 2,3-dioxygenase-like lactoylglutathione lyase family enzyme
MAAAGGRGDIVVSLPDVDADYRRLRDAVEDLVNEPTTMPWGNRSLLFRDPDGNLINLFTPVTAQAVAKFAL